MVPNGSNSWWWSHVGSRQEWPLEQKQESHKLEPQAQSGESKLENDSRLKVSQPASRDILSPVRPHLLNLPKQHHYWRTKYWNVHNTGESRSGYRSGYMHWNVRNIGESRSSYHSGYMPNGKGLNRQAHCRFLSISKVRISLLHSHGSFLQFATWHCHYLPIALTQVSSNCLIQTL